MKNLDILFNYNCKDKTCQEPTKVSCGYCFTEDGKMEKLYQCSKLDCPNRKGKS